MPISEWVFGALKQTGVVLGEKSRCWTPKRCGASRRTLMLNGLPAGPTQIVEFVHHAAGFAAMPPDRVGKRQRTFARVDGTLPADGCAASYL